MTNPTARETLCNRLALDYTAAPCALLDQVLHDCADEELEVLRRIIGRVHVAQTISRMPGGPLRG